MIKVKETIYKYMNIKPKYFNRNEINDITNTFKKTNDYINNLEIQNRKCKCLSLEKENIETGKDKYEDLKERDININDIFNFLNKTQKDRNIIFKVLSYFIYIFLWYIHYLYIYLDKVLDFKFIFRIWFFKIQQINLLIT